MGYGCTRYRELRPLPAIAKSCRNRRLDSPRFSRATETLKAVSPHVKANHLALTAFGGCVCLGWKHPSWFDKRTLGTGSDGQPVYLKIFGQPTQKSAKQSKAVWHQTCSKAVTRCVQGPIEWQSISADTAGEIYDWDAKSTYVANPPYFHGMSKSGKISDIKNANIPGIVWDSITTDHISPAGNIKKDSPAGKYLMEHDVPVADFTLTAHAVVNHEIMMRNLPTSVLLKTKCWMVSKVAWPNTFQPMNKCRFMTLPWNTKKPIHHWSFCRQRIRHRIIKRGQQKGQSFGCQSRDCRELWTHYRSNLVGMGVLLRFQRRQWPARTWELTGEETIGIIGIENGISPHMDKTDSDPQKTDQLKPLNWCAVSTLIWWSRILQKRRRTELCSTPLAS